jgi:hypothetical protein
VVEAMSGIDLAKLMGRVQSEAEAKPGPEPQPKAIEKSTNGHAPSPSA